MNSWAGIPRELVFGASTVAILDGFRGMSSPLHAKVADTLDNPESVLVDVEDECAEGKRGSSCSVGRARL